MARGLEGAPEGASTTSERTLREALDSVSQDGSRILHAPRQKVKVAHSTTMRRDLNLLLASGALLGLLAQGVLHALQVIPLRAVPAYGAAAFTGIVLAAVGSILLRKGCTRSGAWLGAFLALVLACMMLVLNVRAPLEAGATVPLLGAGALLGLAGVLGARAWTLPQEEGGTTLQREARLPGE